MPAAADRIKDDVAESFQLFTEFKDPRELEDSFEVIERALELLTASRSLVFLSFYRFAEKYGPNLSFVEALLKARDDFDRAAVNEAMETIKRKVKEENIGDPPEPTIMKKINVGSLFTRFLPL